MKKFVYILTLMVMVASCQRAPQFRVSGNITDAEGSTLVFEQLALKQTVVLDSVVLNQDGKFCFKQERPAYPELYRLKVGKKQLILAADSTTEHIQISTSLDSLVYAEVSGSENTNKISELRRMLRYSPLDEYKQFAKQTILSDPRSIVAYYALFQQKAGEFVFDIYDKSDRHYYQAVATAWNAFMPESERSKAVYKLTLDVIQQERQETKRLMMQEFIANSENTFLDFSLPDENGKMRYLSDLKGRVFVLDFSAVGMEKSAAYIFELRELYNKYNARGLEIYSVSADQNRLLWEDSAENLPWITVRGDNGVYEDAFTMYNVQQIPTIFLFDKSGEIVGRFADFESLDKAINRCLN